MNRSVGPIVLLAVLALAALALYRLSAPAPWTSALESRPPPAADFLRIHEEAGGHLMARHTGLSADDLAARLAREPEIAAASSFYDRASAQQMILEALDARRAAIDRWLASDSPQLIVRHRARREAGIVLKRGRSKPLTTHKFRLVLRRDDRMPEGFRIHTGYPEP